MKTLATSSLKVHAPRLRGEKKPHKIETFVGAPEYMTRQARKT